MLTLLLGRWVLGFCFPRNDLELLDDPLPDKLYCRQFRREESPSKDVETGLVESDGNSVDGELQPVDMNEAVTSEPTGEQGPSARNALFDVKKSSDFNITQEMDKCDLWKNMVKNYDAPPMSPHKKKGKGATPMIVIEEGETQHQPSSLNSTRNSARRRLELYQSTAV